MAPPRAAKELAASAARAEITLPGCGHSMMAEEPTRCCDALVAFHTRHAT
jgi:pimeloyl-ACP methyl ester carboxylesterase